MTGRDVGSGVQLELPGVVGKGKVIRLVDVVDRRALRALRRGDLEGWLNLLEKAARFDLGRRRRLLGRSRRAA